MLTKDRRLRVKLYSRRIGRNEDTEGGSIIAGGLSLRYVKSFNWWKEVFRIHKPHRKQDSDEAYNQEK
jgi:hypothetical protein